jgi:hypothetical protein
MGEKGNIAGGLVGAAGITAAAEGSAAVFETVTTTATQTVVGVGEDLVATIKDKSIGAVADHTIAAARERLQRPAGDSERAAPQHAESNPAAGAAEADPPSRGPDADGHPAS